MTAAVAEVQPAVIPDGNELIKLPSGARLYYQDDNHSYWRCNPNGKRGRRLSGVSTVVKPLDFRPDNLMNWAVRLAYEGVSRAFAGEQVPDDPHKLRVRLTELRLNWESIRDDAATRGTNVHERMLHALALGGDIPSLDDLEPHERGYGQAVMKFWMDTRPNVLQAEQVVLSDELGVAGRFDLRAEIKELPGTTLLDAKTSAWIGATAHAQIAGYDQLAEECGIGESTHLRILQLRDDGTYALIPCFSDRSTFVDALKTYRNSGQINGQIQKFRNGAL